jgi:large subunit ribosomal protein L1
MEKEQLDKLSAFISENKGQRKFTQSVDITVNFTGIDFSKADSRLNMEISLPNGKGRENKVIVFADDRSLVSRAQAAGAKVIQSSEIPAMSNDRVKLAELLDHELLAQPNLMPQIAKGLGQFLGPRNKMPRPAAGADIGTLIGNMSKMLFVRSKGKYLPTINCAIGTEKMDVNQIAANIDEVVGSFTKKLGKQHIKSVYVKMTMSKPLRLI